MATRREDDPGAAVRRVVFIAFHFPPTGGAGVQRSLKFVRLLPERGWMPTVVTGPLGVVDRWRPSDASLAGEVPAGVDVVRVPGPEPPPRSGPRARAARVLGMREPFSGWWVRGVLSAGLPAAIGADVVLATASPFESLSAGAALARAAGRPWVADLRDPWALDEMQVFLTAAHRALERERMRAVLRRADAIVMNTPEAVRLVRRHLRGLRRIPVVAIPNGFDADDFAAPPAARDPAVFRIVHTGYLHTALGRRHGGRDPRRLLGGTRRGVDILTRSHVHLLEALERVAAAPPPGARPVELVLAGITTEEDREVAAGRGVAVRMPGYLSHRESVALLGSADLLFLPMHDLPAGRRASIVPGKTYEYLASGTPILAAVPDGDARDILRSAGADLCRPADVAGMEHALRRHLELHAAGVRAPGTPAEVASPFERRRLTGHLAQILEEAVRRAGRGARP